MVFWNVFEPRLLMNLEFNLGLYPLFLRRVLNFKVYFPVQFRNTAVTKVEIERNGYVAEKVLQSKIGKDERDIINNAYSLSKQVEGWLDKAIEKGLKEGKIILPPEYGYKTEDGQCFGKCDEEQAPELPAPKKDNFI